MQAPPGTSHQPAAHALVITRRVIKKRPSVCCTTPSSTLKVQVHVGGHLAYLYVVSQQDGVADAFFLGAYGGFEHGGVCAFGKDYAAGAEACGVVEVLRELAFLSHQFAQVLAVGLPVGDFLAGHAALDGCLGHGHGDFGDEARVYGFGDEVVGAEGEVAHVVGAVHDVGHGASRQVGYGPCGGHLHLLVDGLGGGVERAAENVGEACRRES